MVAMTPGPDAAAAGSSTEPDRLVRGWHAAFWIMIGLATLWLLISTGTAASERLIGLGVVALLALAYLVLVQRRQACRVEPDGHAIAYLVIAVASVGVACSVNSFLSTLLFLVYTQIWMFTRTTGAGAGFAAALTLSALLGLLTRIGFTLHALREVGGQLLIGLLFSLALGIWISRVIGQSHERAALIAELGSARSELDRAEHARGVMTERERLAREIHDTLAQGFTSVVMLAQTAAAGLDRDPDRTAERLAAIEEVARENLAEARALVAAFTPVGLEDSSLPDAIRRLTGRFAAQTGTALELHVTDGVTSLTRDREVVVLRAAQECLANVRRHARAGLVVVRLTVDASGAQLEVDDDGVGFDPGRAVGFGLTGMRGRVTEVGGRMEVRSTPGAGTRVTVAVPAAPVPVRPGREAS